MSGLEAFHLIRPAWLMLLAPAALVIWAILRRQDPLQSWRAVIAPELLQHLVMPLTSDPEVIRFFANELDPGVMPTEGDDPVQAIRAANRRLAASGLPGSILLVADRVDPGRAEELERLHDAGGADVHVFAVAAGPEIILPAGSPPAAALDRAAMARVAKAAGGSLVLVTPDDSDIRQLDARIDRSIAAAPLMEGERWADFGYWLLPFFVPLVLLFFRPGGGVALQR